MLPSNAKTYALNILGYKTKKQRIKRLSSHPKAVTVQKNLIVGNKLRAGPQVNQQTVGSKLIA